MAEDNVQANIRIDIDTSDALASIKNLQRQISAFHTSMANGSAANAAAASNFQKTLIDNINATKKFSASVQTVRTTTETFTNSLEKNKLSLGEYFRYAGGASRSFGRFFRTEFDTINKVARERVKDLQTQYIRMGRDANGAVRAIAVRPLVLDMDNLATKTAIAAQRQQLLNQLLKQGSTNLLNFGKNTQWAGRQLMVGFTIPLSIFGATAAKSFMAIEDQAIKFKRVYGDLMTDQGQTDAMLESIKTLASEFTKYGVAVDKTMGLAASAAAQGKTGADLTAQVSEATRLSVLGQVEQQQALETTISVTNAFGVAAEDLASKIDFLNSVENQTVTSIEDLTIAIPKAGPVVKQLGGGVEDLAFFLTAMKEGGINASEGANALKSGLASLINPTEKASNMLAGYGINIKKIVESNKGDVKGVVIDFATALDKLDPLARARAIEQLFGKFQFSRLSTLFQNVIGEGTQASKVLEMAGKTSAELAQLSERELSKVSESSMFKFKKSIEDIKLALAPVGEIFLKLATPVIEFGTKLLTAFNNLDEKTKSFVTGLVAVVGGIGPILLMTFGLLANGVANIIKGFTFVKNVFNRASVSSNDLGSQISYMTTEQIKAASVAASLDQVHGKLTQTFTSEANAIGAYVSALQRANTAAAAFNVPAVGRTRPAAKMANGGMVRGPGGPKDDLVPVDLSNGEAVIDAATVKKNPRIIGALFAGKKINIPGYAKNNSGIVPSKKAPATLDTPSQYMTVFAHIFEPLKMSLQDFADVLTSTGRKVPKDVQRKIDQGLGGAAMRTYGGFGFDTRQSFNEAMKPGRSGVVPKDFLEDYDSRGVAKWSKSLAAAGVKLEDVADELVIFDKSIADQIRAASQLDDNFVVTDKAIAEFAKNTLTQLKNNGGKLSDAFFVAANNTTEARGTATQAQMLAAGYTMDPNRPGYMIGPDGKSADPSKLLKLGGGSKGKTKSGILQGALQEDFKPVALAVVDDVKYEMVSAVKDVTDQSSPSKEAYEAGENIGIGAIQGIESQIDEAKKVGRKNRRVTAVPDGNGGMVIQTPPTQATAFAATKEAKTPRRFIREGDLEVRQKAEASQKSLTTAVEDTASKTRSFGANIRNLSYVLSGLSGIALMSGQSLGEFGNVVFGASVALSALTTAAELNAEGRFLGLNAKSTGAKGISGFFSRMVTVGGKAVMSLGKFVGVLGIAFTVISGFIMLNNWINEQREKERLKIEGLGDAATLTKKKLEALGSFFGKPSTPSVIESIGTVGAGTGPMSADAQTKIKSLREDPAFKEQFAADIKVLGTATKKEAVKTFETLALSLFSKEYTEKEVQQIIDALKIEAGRTDVVFEVKSFDLKTKAGKANFKKSAESMAAEFNKAFEKGRKVSQVQVLSGNMSFGTKEQITQTKEYDAAFETQSTNFANRLMAVQQLFKDGAISNKEYQEQWGVLANALKTGKGAVELTKGVFAKFTEQMKAAKSPFAELLPQIAGTGKEVFIMQSLMLGAIPSVAALSQAIADFKTISDYESGVNKDVQAYVRAQERMSLISKTAEDLRKKQEEVNAATGDYGNDGTGESVFAKAMNQMKQQTAEIANQIKAFNKLKAAGYGTEEAFKLAKDPILAAALASTKVGSKEWKALAKAIKESEKAAKDFKNIQKQTLEGATQEFDDAYSKVGERFSALEEQLQLAFSKANKADNDLISGAQSQIAGLQYTLDDLNASLDDIQLQEDAINKKYDNRIDALEKIQSVNEDISRQQKSQLTIADALSQGDISAAAKAIEDARAEQAASSFENQKKLLENARASEIAGLTVNGKTKAQIEAESLSLQKQIKKIEEETLEPAQERVRLAEERLQKDISALTVSGKTKEEWNLIASNIRIAKTQTDEFVTALKAAEEAARNLNAVLAARTTGRVDSSGVGASASGFALSTSLPGVSGSNSQFGPNTPWARAVAAMGMNNGGMVPKYFAAGGFARGTDTVPAMLTPGEFVVKKYAVENFGTDRLRAINNGSYSGESVYNNYELNVNVRSDANPSEIARVVISQIKQIDSQRVRGIRL
jgi:TP901 family phage tail tape measure protein